MNAHPTSHPTDQTLHAYGLGRLDAASAGSVKQHLDGCADCRQRVATVVSGSPGHPGDVQARGKSLQTTISYSEGLSLVGAAPVAVAGPPPPGALPPGLADHADYEVLRELGQGGMGVVYLARNKLMGRLEVLKVISGHLVNRRGVLDRFLAEIRNAAQLHHPNIVTAYTALRLGGSLVLALEYVDGLDLSRLVKSRGPLPVANACNYVHQAALGLQHAHERGMVHRDIKPGNLMLARQGNRGVVKVLDFGLAKVQSEKPVDGGLTHEGQMLGTPDYIAPEQISDARHADIRADIYSLGCTLYYLLTARPPFQGGSLYDLLQAHHSMEATPLNRVRPDVPAEVAAIAAKMMAKEPAQRFQQPDEVARALRPFLKAADTAPAPAKSQPMNPVRDAGVAMGIPLVERPEAPGRPDAARRPPKAEAVPVAATLIEAREELRPTRDRAGSPALAMAAAGAALLALLTAAVWAWMGRSREGAGVDRAPLALPTGPIAGTAPAAGPKAAGPKAAGPVPRPAEADPEDLVRDALTAVRGGHSSRARHLINQYLSRSPSGKLAAPARELLEDIDLATSSVEAEALARRLSDQEIRDYLANGAEPLTDGAVQTPELRSVYAQTLLKAFRQESRRRPPAPKADMSLARGPEPGPSRAPAPVPNPAPARDINAGRRPGNLLGLADGMATSPGKSPDRKGPTTIETVLDSPGDYVGRTTLLDGLYRVGTLLTPVKGPDGNEIGVSLPIGGDDDRLISKGDGKVVGRDRYLVLDSGLAPVLLRAFNEYKFVRAARPVHKTTLTVTVRPMVVNNASVPVVSIVGMEVLGVCNFLQVAEGQYGKAFMTVHVTTGTSSVAYGDGPDWVARLGGEEKFLKPLRRKLREVRRRMIADRNNAIAGQYLQAALAQAVNMAIANQQQQARMIQAFTRR